MSLQVGIFRDAIAAAREQASEAEQRSSLENPQTPLSYPAEWLLDIFNGGRTDSGIRVSELTAFQVATFLACVDLIAGSVAALPMHVYERSLNEHGRPIHRLALEHDLYDLVNIEPNDEMSRSTLIKAFVSHCLAWGNGYIEIQRDYGSAPIALWPRNPYKTRPFRIQKALVLDPVPWRPFPVALAAGTLVYKTSDHIDDQDESEVGDRSVAERIIPKEDMLHVPGLALDGRVGQSVVWMARNLLGLALATEKFGAKYFANFSKPGGLLTIPTVSPEQRTAARNSWMEAQGGENAHRTAVLPAGSSFTPISYSPEQSQTLETRKFLRTEIAGIFHVPPHMVGDVDKGRANTEQMAQEFIQYTLTPWLSALRQEFKRKLFPHTGIGRTPRNPYYVDFDLSQMLRPDAQSREKFNASGRQWGYLSANDVRANEGLNPVEAPWAEEYWMPVNMTLSTTPVDPAGGPSADPGESGESPDHEPDNSAEEGSANKRAAKRARDASGRFQKKKEVSKA
jgi:HK97 family phage portal protein